ncbi:thioesterase family protein [Demetria terragena]|uniref:thioesterase family protein n=1 Tax=Demetria terragena TaxID=63959 RepID=UPI00036F39CD|nr:thioesterase family protein [Demetria terragena]
MSAYFVPLGPLTFRPTELTQGAWRDDEQHVSIVCGLVGHVLEQHVPRPEMAYSRITFEIFGQVLREDMTFEVATIRPGRTIELVEVTGTCGERTILRVRAWRLVTSDTSSVEGVELPAMPARSATEPRDVAAEWGGKFLKTIEWQAIPGGRDGRRQVWVHTAVDLVEGVQAGPLARFLSLIDIANGIATRQRPGTMMFPNVELTVHLLREPVTENGWVGLDTSVTFGDSGIGITHTVLNDSLGPVGMATQSLTLRL